MKEKPYYDTEAKLCAEFIGCIGRKWVAYPETAGWDILLVRKADGLQIGVEAKLRLNAKVLAQAIEDHWNWPDLPGPDCRAVLVPTGDGDIARIAAYIGITVIVQRPPFPRGVSGSRFLPALPVVDVRWSGDNRDWFPQFPNRRHDLPDYVPDVAAGEPAPVRLTDWKIKAIKLAVILERRGAVTRHDFKALELDHRRWIAREAEWLTPGEHGWVAGPRFPDLRSQHPRNFEEIAADADAWMPPAPAVQARLGLGGQG